MAKLRAPLFSFRASGALAKSLVFFGWKGLNVVRSYVVPAYKRTTAQATQRDYLKACVAAIHANQAVAVDPLDETDTTAYALLGSLQPTPRTWFNTICRQWMKQKVATKIPMIYCDMAAVGGATKLTVTGSPQVESGALTSGKLHYGTSKTALVNSIACTKAELIAGKDIPGLSAGIKYFVQFRPLLPDTFIGSISGIYHGVPTA